MNSYLGIIIENALKCPITDSELKVVSSKQVGSWVFSLVSAEDCELDQQISWLQANMLTDECWYAHYFKNDQMIVVYADKVFHTTLNPETWHDAIEHGLQQGVSLEQLNFAPNSAEDATRFFARSMLIHS